MKAAWIGFLNQFDFRGKVKGLDLLGVVPHDDLVYQYDCEGRPTVTLPMDSPVRKALREIVGRLGL